MVNEKNFVAFIKSNNSCCVVTIIVNSELAKVNVVENCTVSGT